MIIQIVELGLTSNDRIRRNSYVISEFLLPLAAVVGGLTAAVGLVR